MEQCQTMPRVKQSRSRFELLRYVGALMPLLLAQIVQRFYYILMSRYIAEMGHSALIIQSIQYVFITIGQLLGTACSISCLIFWKRKEFADKQKTLCYRLCLLTIAVLSIIALACCPFLGLCLHHYGVKGAYYQVGLYFLAFSLLNMILQAMYVALSGMLLASKQYIKSMALALVLVVGMMLMGHVCIAYFHRTDIGSGMSSPLTFFAVGTALLLSIVTLVSLFFVINRANGSGAVSVKSIFCIWRNEIGVGVMRSIAPIVYALQLHYIQSSQSMLVVYQFVLHVAYILCLPLILAAQIAVRDKAEVISNQQEDAGLWKKKLIVTGLLPTGVLLLLAAVFNNGVIQLFYNVTLSPAVSSFVALYFIACLIGQFGTAVAAPIRAYKKNSRLIWNFFFAEIGINIGGTQLLIHYHLATPVAIGWLTNVFTAIYFISNVLYYRKITQGVYR